MNISINLWEVSLQVEDFSGSMFSVGIKVNFSYVKVPWMFWGPERGLCEKVFRFGKQECMFGSWQLHFF